MADVFTRTEVNFGGAMHAQFGILTPNNGLDGVLMQNLQLQYSQQVTRVYEVGNAGQKTNVYYVGGRSQGQMSAAHIVGPGVSIKAFYKNYGDVCNAGQNPAMLKFGPNICGGASGGNTNLTYTMKYCVLVQIGMSVAAQDFVINESSTLMFSGLDLT